MKNKEYLFAVKNYLTRHYSSELVSIILYGSVVDNQENIAHSSDVDLLIIIKDNTPALIFDKIYRDIIGIEAHFFSTKTSFFGFFSKGLQNATGMFINLFVCRYSDIKRRNFTRVFSVNPLMVLLFAPKTSVWISLQQRHSVIWGKEIFAESGKIVNIPFSDVLRSFSMNFLLSLGAISLSFLTRSMTQFAMEAVKWSLFTWKNYSKLPNPSLLIICYKYAQNASIFEKRLLSSFIFFRKTQEPDNYLLLFAPLFIVKLHCKLIHKMRDEY